jgi:TonB-dependent starch-binding outer membrane protein SusC
LLTLLVPLSLSAQATGQVTGRVTTDAGQPLAGVQVSVQGTQVGTITSSDGRFSLARVPLGPQTVRATFVGYGSQDLAVTVTEGTPAVANFQLQSRAIALEGVVAVGYGTQRREEITGAVASVSSDQFVQAPARDAAALIAGKVPGLAVTTSSGDPRAGTEISLRGATTLQGPRNPLVLVDGVPGNLRTVAPQDIESISVLKDGSAAAVYGSRASNGVILITTKRHTGGAPTIRYDGYLAGETIARTPDFLNADDYRRLISEGYAFEDLGHSTNWQDEVLRSPVSHRHNVTISGGLPNTNYTAAVNHEDAQGLFQRSDNRETTGRINVGHSMYDGRLHADVNLLSRVQSFFTGPNFDYIWRQTLIRNPTDRVRTDAGEWQERGTYFYTNPAGLLNEQDGDYEQRNLRMHGTLTFRPIQSLRLSMMGGTSRTSVLEGNATTFQHVNTTQSGLNGTAFRGTSSNLDRVLEMTGTYENRLGDHNVTLLGGYGYQDFTSEFFNAYNYGFPTDLFGYNQLQRGNAVTLGQATMNSSKSDYKLIGFFSRLNYDWNNRWLLMGSVRYEGNSRFGADHKWGIFPAISAGWRISEEAFVKNNAPFINDLKVRAGYGVTGIAPNNSYLSLTSFGYGARFLYNGQWVQGLSPSRNPNPDLRWERKDEINVGVDFSLMDFRLNGSLDVYQRDTRDMLYNYSVPVPPYLFGSMLANVGHMQNKGVEAQLGYDVLKGTGLNWTTSVNGSTNSNRLVSLSNDVFSAADFFYAGHTGEPIQLSTHRVDIGGPIGNFYGFKSVDIDDNGEWIVLNAAGEPIPIRQVRDGDRHVLGNGIPKYYLGWNNSAQLGSFDFNLNMRGAFGFQILNFQQMYYSNPKILQYNMLRSAFDPVYGKRPVNYDLAYVSYYVEDGDYWKLDNMSLGYTLSPRLLGATRGAVSNARVYVAGRNLYTFTGYKGLDPEVSTAGLDPGTDHRDRYPTTRTFTVGATMTF